MYSRKQIDRFWSHVEKAGPNDCWLWKRSKHNKGYGQVGFGVNGKVEMHKAHKVAWEITHNRLIPKGVHGLHTCDTRACCNPHHVFLGSNADNMADRDAKGRQARGERHGAAKISDDQARLVKYRLGGLKISEIAKLIGVSYHLVYGIREGRTWAHI